MRRLNELKYPKKKILFLGYDETETKLIHALIHKKCLVDHTSQKVENISKYDFVVSFGYRHILKQKQIERFRCPIFNLHISYLPYNRGAHPNFWSFYENTPAGVTIHLIDKGIDTGPIISQKYVRFDKRDDTFFKTYKVLKREMELLFLSNIDTLLSNKWVTKLQKGIGSHHKIRDLPSNFSGWNSNISQEIKKLKKEGLKYE